MEKPTSNMVSGYAKWCHYNECNPNDYPDCRGECINKKIDYGYDGWEHHECCDEEFAVDCCCRCSNIDHPECRGECLSRKGERCYNKLTLQHLNCADGCIYDSDMCTYTETHTECMKKCQFGCTHCNHNKWKDIHAWCGPSTPIGFCHHDPFSSVCNEKTWDKIHSDCKSKCIYDCESMRCNYASWKKIHSQCYTECNYGSITCTSASWTINKKSVKSCRIGCLYCSVVHETHRDCMWTCKYSPGWDYYCPDNIRNLHKDCDRFVCKYEYKNSGPESYFIIK